MSADNEVSILEMPDAQGFKSYRVAGNVSASYNILSPEIDYSNDDELHMTYKIWEFAMEFYHSKDAFEYARKLQNENYYEYGITNFRIEIDWDAIVKREEEISCKTCGGSGEFECFENSWGEHGSNCPSCGGYGLEKKDGR